MSNADQVGRPTVTAQRINQLAAQDSVQINETVSDSQSSHLANQEESLLGQKDLEKVSRDNQHQRDEDWKSLFDCAFKWVFRLIAVLFAFMVVALILHWILPEYCHWLSINQLNKIEAIVVAVLVSKAVTAKQGKIE